MSIFGSIRISSDRFPHHLNSSGGNSSSAARTAEIEKSTPPEKTKKFFLSSLTRVRRYFGQASREIGPVAVVGNANPPALPELFRVALFDRVPGNL